ncbi:hypothetical protein [Actinoplanes couchii]|uniref:Uncharacterized protein n=1 Tax=Actinoplanes couchii TaxID=403638 RepID=A0ABQ3X989_9ACTN|nr:hypothetical protein [Actinoplanes couchii]MDR6325760.1 hypothetical protein [Actinoplanes couchii]GID55072.1 hypothetical protein Aco03nite_034760 [Actinoplanes couchii]
MTYPPPPGQPGYPNQGDPNQPYQPPYGQPQQPQYGQPQSPAPQFGAPQPPPYGQPQPPQFGGPQPPQPPQPPQFGGPPPPQPPQFGGPQQPPFGQPGFPPPPGFPQPPAKKSKAVPIVLISLAIVLVLCVGGTTVFYLIGKNAEDAAAKISIAEPATLGGLAKLNSAEFEEITADMEKELAQYPGAESSFGAIYGSPEDKNMVAALATKATIADPQKELDASFTTFGQSSKVNGIVDVGTGTLGGVAQCGTSAISGIDVAICGWADEGSVGMIMYFFKTAADIKDEFPDRRAEIETKS